MITLLILISGCLRVCIAVGGDHDHGSSYTGRHLVGSGLWLKGLVHCQHGRKQGATQTDWRGCWEFYIRVNRQQKETETLVLALAPVTSEPIPQ